MSARRNEAYDWLLVTSYLLLIIYKDYSADGLLVFIDWIATEQLHMRESYLITLGFIFPIYKIVILLLIS